MAELIDIELNLLLEAIYQRYGWDFRHYKRASLRRSILRVLSRLNIDRVSEIIPKALVDETIMYQILCGFSIPVSEMFRDPDVFLKIRQKIIPILRTYPFIKVWHAGCASGEEVYSMAILLKEEGLYDRARIYGTDINPMILEKAKEGIFSLDNLDKFDENYKRSGGKHSLTDYFHSDNDATIINSNLKKNISFFNHNLVTDQSFGEMNLILCRNVLIYFDKALQGKVINLFEQSLRYGGFLCLGTKESLNFLEIDSSLQVWQDKERIYRKGRTKSEDTSYEYNAQRL